MDSETNREARLRQRAHTRGYHIVKSRVRNPEDPTYGGYMLVESYSNRVELGGYGNGYTATLDDIEEFLKDDDDEGQSGATAQ